MGMALLATPFLVFMHIVHLCIHTLLFGVSYPQVRFRGLADTIRLLGCFCLEALEVVPYTGEPIPTSNKAKRMLSASSTHLPLSPTPSTDSVRSSVMFDGPLEPELNSSTLLYSANEMFKNLFEMATDSFGLKAGNYGPTDTMNGLSVPHYGSPVLSIYHSGAITAVVDLLPAICEMGEDGKLVLNSEVSRLTCFSTSSSSSSYFFITSIIIITTFFLKFFLKVFSSVIQLFCKFYNHYHNQQQKQTVNSR